jgi:isoleucyl-tRNA synthetase
VIFRNTPQWFIAMDKPIADNGRARPGDTLRARALHAISVTQWAPPAGQNRINGMIAGRPDWVISRQRLGRRSPCSCAKGRWLRRDPAG